MSTPTYDPCAESPEKLYGTLLDVAESIAVHRDLPELFHDLAGKLHSIVRFDFISLILHDSERDVMRLHILETIRPARAPVGYECPIDDGPAGVVWQTQRPVLIPNIEDETSFTGCMSLLQEHGMKSACWLPLSTAQRRVGVLGFGCAIEAAYNECDLELMHHAARQVAVAVDNALNFERAQLYQDQLARERDHQRLLLEVNNAVVSNLDLSDLLIAIAACLRRVMSHEVTSLCLYNPETRTLRLHALDYPNGNELIRGEIQAPIEGTPAWLAYTSRQAVLVHEEEFKRLPSEITRLLVAAGIRSACCVPLIAHDRVVGTLNVGSTREDAFSAENVILLNQVAGQIAIAVDNSVAYQEIADLKNKLAQEKLYLEDEIRTDHNFDEIIGESAALIRILKQVETVAPTDSIVLIQGETGTGKELIARAIHNLSHRRERTLVKLNCAAIPTGLLESELFGHEKGAFTGAISQRIGRFELAHRGTLFLDEVGDIPLELQPKLLRVLQEQEFERLGSTRTQRVDIRLIGATNQDLAGMVAEKQFRSDLYYRLNVFPITVPPLRERPEDIPFLVRYFAQMYSRRINKRIKTVPAETMAALTQYQWPGNVRELENLVERAIILSPGTVLNVPLSEVKQRTEPAKASTTLEAAEREHILHALQDSKWVIGGPDGAAVRLGMKRTTLQSKMQRLGISRP